MRHFGAVLLVAALSAPPVAADPLALYQSGKYEQAIAEASHENSAGGFALAARAALADAMLRSPCLRCLRRAGDLARKSIALDSKLPDGHVYLAISLGYQARIVGIVRAKLGGYPEEARRNLDDALTSDPRNAGALAALGGWNVEIVRNGGDRLARWLYGASLEEGQKDFAAAFKLAPGNLVLRYQYGLSLGGLDLAEWHGQVSDALTRACDATPRTAYENFAQARACELLETLKKNDDAAFDRLLRRDQGYP